MTSTRNLWRGALGGVVGGFIGAAVLWPSYKPQYGQGTEFRWFVLFVIVYSPFAAIAGAAIGILIWKIRERTRRSVNLLTRAILGATSAGVLGILCSYTLYSDVDRASLGLSYTMFYAKYGVFVGTLAGIFAKPSQPKQ